jgi:hypothetical protein
MMYTHENAPGSTVFDVETGEKINYVRAADTEAGVLECFHHPYRIKPGTDEVETFRVKFRTIHPIFGLDRKPQLFHCYGRKP